MLMTNPRKTALGRRLTELRKRLGITQTEAAERIKVSLRTWQSWEGGEQVPTDSHALLIKLLESGKL